MGTGPWWPGPEVAELRAAGGRVEHIAPLPTHAKKAKPKTAPVVTQPKPAPPAGPGKIDIG